MVYFIMIFFVLFLFAFSLMGQSFPGPKTPNLPGEPGVQSNIPDKQKTKEKPVLKLLSRRVRVHFCNGRSMTGQLKNLPVKIHFQHHVDGILFHKTLAIKEISAIRFLKWQKQAVRQKSQSAIFLFYPAKIKILTYQQGSFFIEKLDRLAIYKFTLQNRNGRTLLYSYWYHKKSKQKAIQSVRKCHPNAIQQIEFSDKFL